MNKLNMSKIGFDEKFYIKPLTFDGLFTGRVFSQEKGLYKVMCENGEVDAEISGKLRFEATKASDFPAVGDFVLLDRLNNTGGNAIIHDVFARKSVFIRKAAGTSNEEQVVASNIDTVFICMSLNQDFNLRRLERYLSIAWDSGATPVIVLTKADLCEEVAVRLEEVRAVAFGVDVLVTSAIEEDGYLQVAQYISAGKTAAFIGSSGVGKSTLINCLLGADRQDTKGLRNDDKGRHTTTKRELFILANGGMVIDTPGMRELGLESVDLQRTFADVEELALGCKFTDCTHTSEPGCCIQKAVEEGVLSQERLLSYKKLKKEAKYEGLNSKQIETVKLNEMFSGVGGMKNARRFIKENNKRR
ncbi:ribosome small subunit-dependent GTPase A [Clostridia bacterium OttesenSCG-928-F22]|nr:ribosome small subunit-dependent GTPase A [Clostridia bacterium OttesenSCG-928-F22]